MVGRSLFQQWGVDLSTPTEYATMLEKDELQYSVTYIEKIADDPKTHTKKFSASSAAGIDAQLDQIDKDPNKTLLRVDEIKDPRTPTKTLSKGLGTLPRGYFRRTLFYETLTWLEHGLFYYTLLFVCAPMIFEYMMGQRIDATESVLGETFGEGESFWGYGPGYFDQPQQTPVKLVEQLVSPVLFSWYYGYSALATIAFSGYVATTPGATRSIQCGWSTGGTQTRQGISSTGLSESIVTETVCCAI
jgi:hypothetical protein